MHILYDGRILELGLQNSIARTGIYFVARNLLLEFIKNDNINVSLYLPENNSDFVNEIFKSLNIKPINIYSDNSDLSQINTFFSPSQVKPSIIDKYPNISCYTVLYDTIPMMFQEYFGGKLPKWYEELLSNLNENDYYFSISEHTKKDFLKYFPQLNTKNIKTMLLSTNFEYKRNTNTEARNIVNKKYNIPQDTKYLFSLCSLEPRKNLIRAVKTFIEFIKKNNINDLVFVLGGAAWDGFIEKFEKEVPEYEKYKDKIIRGGYIDDEDLEVLYSNAEWFTYTSQYEGFGMPPLEAMSCGCPVITSNNSSLPEVVGDAGIMIDFDSDEQHIQAYEKYYFDKNFRQEMAQKGFERSKLFSWEKAIDIILNKMYKVEERKAQKPLVTIITATYNLISCGRKDWFIQNLESVQNQTYKNIEHIIIDGKSSDGTIELLEKFQQKGWIKYYSEPDKGIYDALNKGILKANGKYVVCLNSDDFYCDNNALEWLVSKAEETEADACCASARSVYPETSTLASIWSVNQTDNLIFGNMACHQTFLIKTDVMKELGLYNLKYKISSDTGFMYKMLKNNKKFVKISPIIITYRLGGASNDPTKVDEDVSQSLYEEYSKDKYLSFYDVKQLIRFKYLQLPLKQSIRLGAKLVYTGKEKWIEEYFTRLIENCVCQVKQNAIEWLTFADLIKLFISMIFSVKDTYNNGVKRKIITLLGLKLKIKLKQKIKISKY